jgi:hypothetical protein
MMAVVAAALLAGAQARAGMGATSFSDSFRDGGLVSRLKQASVAKGGGITVDPAEQVWEFPGKQGFTAGAHDRGAAVVKGRGGKEEVTLWQEVLAPGRGLKVARACSPGGRKPCPLDRSVKGRADGIVVQARGGGYPYAGPSVPVASWGTTALNADCDSGPGLSGLAGSPFIESEAGPMLADHVPLAASFLVSGGGGQCQAPLVEFRFREPGAGRTRGGWTANETDLGRVMSRNFAGMSPFTVRLDSAAGGTPLSVGAVCLSGTGNRCAAAGPVYLTALSGRWVSPVLDTLSDRTSWVKLEWRADQNSDRPDPSCARPTPGAPLTPVVLAYGVVTSGTSIPVAQVQAPSPDSASMPFPRAVTGRYMVVQATLFGRLASSLVSADLAPRDAHRHFSGWRPSLRDVRVRYFARAGEAESRLVAPRSIASWGVLRWSGRTPGRSTIAIDILAEDGTVLSSDVPRAADLSAAIPAFVHSALKVRARLACDPGDPGNRPVLEGWEMGWVPLKDRMALERPSFRPSEGEVLRGVVAARSAGRLEVRVHDSGGRTVATLVSERKWPARARAFAWDGRDSRGRLAPPGRYAVTATAEDGAGTRPAEVVP